MVAGRDTKKIESSVGELKQRIAKRGLLGRRHRSGRHARLCRPSLARAGTIDILVNAQGTTVIKPALDFIEAEYAQVMRTNVEGVFLACTEFGRHMVERKSGSIINIGSLSSFRGWPRQRVYGMTKWAVVSLTQSLAAEWAGAACASTRSRRASS